MIALLTRHLPAYLFKKANVIKIVAFTAVYASIFINIYKPFGSGNWMENTSQFYFFLYSSVIVLIGFVVIALSRIVMYFWYQRQAIVYIQYLIWILFEVIFMSIFFTIIVLAIRPEVNAWLTFKDSFYNTVLILVLPYFICHIFLSMSERNKELEERDRIKPLDSSVRMIDFYDERETLRLSVMKSKVIYVEAADNYVYIFYKKQSGVTRFMLRNRLKAMEKYLADVDIVRCHRSYMVNLEYVSVIRREPGGIYLELSIPEVPDIPLSQTYRDKVDAWFRTAE
ncbi:MAG: LytTR family transcriptional regulator [Bacteroidaceae bacterium]|nr:LytTR family transcriptional regulator [Bacteroidaceae bacterium]